MDIQYFEKLWESKKSSISADKEFWDSRAGEFNSRGANERMSRIVEMLTDRGMLTSESEVLDIGCGPGKYAMEFAKTAKRVVGLDISSKMVQYARENAVKNQMSNTEFRALPWEEANLQELGWNKKFNLVTAIMSPAINSKESLDKMNFKSSEGEYRLQHLL